MVPEVEKHMASGLHLLQAMGSVPSQWRPGCHPSSQSSDTRILIFPRFPHHPPVFFFLHCLQVLPPRAPSHCVVAGWLLSEDCSLLLGIQSVPDLARVSVETGAVRVNNGLLHYCRAISHGRHSSTKISKYTWGLRMISLSFGRAWQVLFTRVTWITTWAKLLVSSCS